MIHTQITNSYRDDGAVPSRLTPLVAEDPSRATVCLNGIQSKTCYTFVKYVHTIHKDI